MVIELFSGTGGVTAALRSFGFDAVGIDKIHLKHALAAPMLLDVASPEGLQTLLTLIRSPSVVGIWAAPACGTCSAARDIPCRDAAGNLVPGPRPLRSDFCPDGLPHLNAKDKGRVALASASYEALQQQAIALAVQRGLVVAVENPNNSLFWRTSFWIAVRDSFNFTWLHQCAFGGRRPKYTAVARNHPAFCSLRRSCQCTEPHEPWGRNSSAPNGWAPQECCGGHRLVLRGVLQSNCACPWAGLASAQSRRRHAAQSQQISTAGYRARQCLHCPQLACRHTFTMSRHVPT